ncbi:hypothetical protein EVAR_89863_1 [Eumeta japonica]|uniref:Uncharacterized protein n=1 Tax=Eumeta variegata TaxID=151549 RepID=A0A4C1ZZ24_EUMVA|nr:hypothetical protein EVAR_89863_1 [Eumeta japonica]
MKYFLRSHRKSDTEPAAGSSVDSLGDCDRSKYETSEAGASHLCTGPRLIPQGGSSSRTSSYVSCLLLVTESHNFYLI